MGHCQKYHNTYSLFDPPKFYIIIVSIFSWNPLWSEEKIKTILMQNFRGASKDYYGIFLKVAHYENCFFFFGESGPRKYVLNAPIHSSTYEPRANLVIRKDLVRPSLYSYHHIPRKCQQAFTMFPKAFTIFPQAVISMIKRLNTA